MKLTKEEKKIMITLIDKEIKIMGVLGNFSKTFETYKKVLNYKITLLNLKNKMER